ncbi:MAG: hypothetical protein ABSF62_02350 [Bryobacteraceae bacterium]
MPGTPFKQYAYMALRLAGVTKVADASTNIPSPDQLADCLLQAQLMISEANIRRSMVYSILLTTYVLGTGELYTLGPSGTLVSTTGTSVRPIEIERARLILSTTGTPVHLPVFKGTFREFSDLKVQSIPGALPQMIYCDDAYPLANVYIVPQDVGGDSLELYTWQTLPNLATVGDSIYLAPGYDAWFVPNLAVRLASVFKEQGASVSDDTRQEARRTSAAIMQKNAKSPRMKSDAPGSSGRAGDFNWLSGH